MFDIHSHILPAIDDGAQYLEESLKLLELMRAEGITHVMATPHFYPQDTNLEYFLRASVSSFNKLNEKIENLNLPKFF